MAYWQNRYIKQRDLLFDGIDAATDAAIAKRYVSTLNRLKRDIEWLYEDIIKDNITSISALYRYNRYIDLTNNLNRELTALGQAEQDILTPAMMDLYTKQANALNQPFGLQGTVNPANVENVIHTVWAADGKDYSQRIWQHMDQLKVKIEQGLSDCLIRGASSKEMAADLVNTFGVSFGEAKRLTRTELTYAQQQATIDKYREAGIEYVMIITAEDERTCDACAAKNGMKFRADKITMDDIIEHPNCRCCLVPYIDD